MLFFVVVVVFSRKVVYFSARMDRFSLSFTWLFISGVIVGGLDQIRIRKRRRSSRWFLNVLPRISTSLASTFFTSWSVFLLRLAFAFRNPLWSGKKGKKVRKRKKIESPLRFFRLFHSLLRALVSFLFIYPLFFFIYFFFPLFLRSPFSSSLFFKISFLSLPLEEISFFSLILSPALP